MSHIICQLNDLFKSYHMTHMIYFRWEQVKGGVIPANAIPGGNYPTGEEVYLGRGKVRQNR